MYEDDALSAAALMILEKQFKQRSLLRDACSGVTLLEHEEVPVFGHLGPMLSELSYNLALLDWHERWGVKSPIAGDFDQGCFLLVMDTIKRLHEFLLTPEATDWDATQAAAAAEAAGGSATETKEEGSAGGKPGKGGAPRRRKAGMGLFGRGKKKGEGPTAEEAAEAEAANAGADPTVSAAPSDGRPVDRFRQVAFCESGAVFFFLCFFLPLTLGEVARCSC